VVNRRNITERRRKPRPPRFDHQVRHRGQRGRLVGRPEHRAELDPRLLVDGDQERLCGGKSDGIVQKYAPTQAAAADRHPRKFDSVAAPGAARAQRRARPASHASGIVVDPGNGDIYISDGYGNAASCVRQVGKFLRQWGPAVHDEESQNNVPGVFPRWCMHRHEQCRLIYACDRQGNRVQVFQKDGILRAQHPDPEQVGKVPDKRAPRGGWRSRPIRAEADVHDERRPRGGAHPRSCQRQDPVELGRPGHQAGNFTHGHTLAVDSKGNVYLAETDWGRRIQKFKIVN